MADFVKAYRRTARNEGGYVHDPDDHGGETYKGIARKFHPGWKGWEIIDQHRARPDFPKCLYGITFLDSLVLSFYRITFWDEMRGDEIKSQEAAASIFDSSVNFGLRGAIKLAQQALNMPETGKMDDATLAKINNGK